MLNEYSRQVLDAVKSQEALVTEAKSTTKDELATLKVLRALVCPMDKGSEKQIKSLSSRRHLRRLEAGKHVERMRSLNEIVAQSGV
jgi:hypothetical protein